MKSNCVKCGRIALAAICAMATIQVTALAATPTGLFWAGGPGKWNADATQQWYPGITQSTWTPVGSATQWDNTSGTAVANIGYLTASGSGGGYYGTTAINQIGTPSVINLDPDNQIDLSALNFGYIGTSSANATASAYALNGGTLNFQNSANIALDLSYSSANNPGTMRTTINSDIIATSGTLSFTTLQYSGSAGLNTAGGILNLGGTNTFGTLNIGGIINTSAINSAYWSGVVITNPAAINGANGAQTPNVILGNNGALDSVCANGVNINVGSIQLSGSGSYLHNSTYGAYSTTGIGRVGAGAYTDPTNAWPSITVQGAISGPADMVFGSGGGNDSRGVIILNAQSTYQGDTFMQQSSNRWAGDPEGMAVVQLGINNALPVTTNLIFGRNNSTGNSGALDLHGFSQQLRSIGSMLSGAGSTTNDYCGGITNFASTTGTLSLLNDLSNSNITNPHFIESQFHGIIGATVLDLTSRPTASVNSDNKVELVLGSASGANTCVLTSGGTVGNGMSLTLGLAGSNEAPPAYPLSQANTYNGGTIINGGALFVATGRVFSTSGTNANSATGTGPVTVNQNGVLGGSIAGGAIGMPDSVAFANGAVGPTGGSLGTGRVTVNAGGYLLPGGGYFVNSQGLGAGGYASGATVPVFHAVANVPLNVLGDLYLNANANVNFNFSGSQSDCLKIGGALSLPATGSVDINLNATDLQGSLASGTPLFEFNSLTSAFNASQLTLGNLNLGGTGSWTGGNPGITFQQVGNEIDVVVPGASQLQRWNGLANSTWDTSTGNFKYLGNTTTSFSTGNTVWFDDTATGSGTVNIATSVNPGRVAFLNASKAYTITGGSITGAGAVLVAGGGTVTFANSGNSYSGGTTVENNSTLQVSGSAALPATGTVTIQDNSTLSLGAGTYGTGGTSNTLTVGFQAGGLGTGSTPAISVPAGQTAVFNGILNMDINNGIGLNKTGPGTLILANTNAYNALGNIGTGTSYGAVNVNDGVLRIEATVASGGTSSTNISQLGRGPITIARTGNGGALWLDNCTVNANTNSGLSLGFVDVYPGGTLGGTGNAAYAYSNISLVMNTVTAARPAGSFTLATGTSRTDSLALQASFEDYDNNSGQNNYENFNLNPGLPLYSASSGLTVPAGTYASANMGTYSPLMTVHVSGSGSVKLQSGETVTRYTFGGAWSVDSGILQVGPFVADTNYTTSAGTGWKGCSGEALNALGFATPIAQNITIQAGVTGNPDLPSPVTVNGGGILALAVDQINRNPSNSTAEVPVNPTPSYLRNAVTLNGGAVAATGYDVMFYKSGGTAQAVTVSGSNSAVVARFGGDFTIGNGVTTASGSGSVLTYDPNGPVLQDSFGTAIVGDNGARTVELVGGSRFLANASPGLAASTTLTYATNWNGTLVVASSGTTGGTFNIKRSGGTVNVLPGAQIVVQPYATVNISDDNSSMLVSSTASNSTYGFMVAPSSGPTSLPVLNNVLSAGGNSVAVVNNGTFNVNNGSQTVGAITGNGSFNVTGTATASAPSIVQSAANVGSSATLNLTGPGAVASSLLLANSGNLNVTGGSHTINAISAADVNGLPVGTTTVSGGTLAASQVYQGTLNANPGGTIQLTTPAGIGNIDNVVNTLNMNGGKLDVQSSGIYAANTGGTAAVYSAIKGGNITSSTLVASSSSTYGVGNVPNYGGSGYTLIKTALLGDAYLEGSVSADDRALVSGSNSNLGKTSVGWSGGDFYYQGVVTTNDRAAEVRNETSGISFNGLPAIKPLVQLGGSGSAEVDYNSGTGVLSLVIAGNPDVDSFNVYMQNADPSAQQNNLGSGWQTLDNTAALLSTYEWAKITTGDPTADLAPGSYELAQLSPGLTSSAFGAGGVAFFDANGNETDDSVAVVPEPGTLALLTVAGLLGVGAAVVRRRRKTGDNPQG